MCYRKVLVTNPSYDPAKSWSKPKTWQPCGECDECVQLMTSEYAFRAQMETLYCTGASSGFAYFNTFTYNNRYVPLLRMKESNALIKTWNKKHIQNFLKRLRQFFFYYYGVEKDLIKYIITCERGSNRYYEHKRTKTDRKTGKKSIIKRKRQSTERPHYHSIIWLYCSQKQFETIKRPRYTVDHLPDWCKGYTLIDDVFPLAFQHFWSDPDTGRSYGHIDNEMLYRSPAIAAKYVTKYIFKQRNDITYRIPLDKIAYHLQDIDRKDFQPFTLMSNFIGADFKPTFEHLTGEKQVTFLSSDNHACAINLPRYYYKRYCKETTTTDEIKRSKVVAADWTVKDGFEPSHYYSFLESEKTSDGWLKDGKLFPFEYKTKTVDNKLGEKVALKRFDLMIDAAYDRIMKFVRDSQYELKTAKKYNKLIHTDEYAIQFHNDPLDFKAYTYNPATSQVNSLKEDGTPIFDYIIRTDMSMYDRLCKAIEIVNLFMCGTSDTRQLLYIHDSSVWGELFDNAEANMKQAIRDYYHEGLDTSMPLLMAIDEILMFFNDMDMIDSAVKRHNNSLKYRMQLPTVMTKCAPLFAPRELEPDNDF